MTELSGLNLTSGLTSSRALLFDGVLYNRDELLEQLGARATLSDSALLLLAYERWGLDLLHHIDGNFVLVVADAERRQVLAARDALGAYPLFYAEAAGRLLFSTSIDCLRERPHVNRAVNRSAVADHLSHRWPDPGETYFVGIRRLPAGNALYHANGRLDVDRYWDPAPPGKPIDWISDDVQARFDAVFERAVARSFGREQTGLFLSGGLDSISVGAVATDMTRRNGHPPPIALSLDFPGECSEATEQRGVARSLGLSLDLVPFETASPPGQLLSAALELTRTRPAPVINTWAPAYIYLSQCGKHRGVRTILSGAGGDEWLAVSPYLAADFIRALDLKRLVHLMYGWQRSYHQWPHQVVRLLLWTYGSRPLGSALLDRIAPRQWKANRVGRVVRQTPAWVAPDPQLRAELDARVERWFPSANPPAGFYFQDVRVSLQHTLTSMELEEIFETGRRLDIRYPHPYWDAGVVDMLYRTPPHLLLSGGRAKNLVRQKMASRFPGLGLAKQKKRAGTTFYRSVLMREIPDLWRRHGDLPALADLKIVDHAKAAAMVERSLTPDFRESLRQIWDLINLDVWIQAHH